MNKIIFTIAFFGCIFLQAQTKLIQHRSHSGNDAEFVYAYTCEAIPNSNLGVAPTRFVRTAQLDSLIFINDSVAIMATSRYCNEDYSPIEEKSLWRAGRDSIFHHPLFSKQHQLDKIKLTIKNDYNFRNKINEVIFIGYDNNKKDVPIKQYNQQQQNENQPQDINQQQQLPNGKTSSIGLFFAASIGIAMLGIQIKKYIA